jgi:hypothetical protein
VGFQNVLIQLIEFKKTGIWLSQSFYLYLYQRALLHMHVTVTGGYCPSGYNYEPIIKQAVNVQQRTDLDLTYSLNTQVGFCLLPL